MNARRATSAGLVLALGLGVASPVLLDIGMRPVDSVRIAGEFERVSRGALESTLERHLSGGFFDVDVGAIRAAALALPWIRDVSVRKVWPDGLLIAVTEREAVARWNGDRLLEDDAAVFAPTEAASPGALPALEGPDGTERLVLERYRTLSGPVRGATGASITALSLNHRGSWRLALDNGVAIVLGQDADDATFARYVSAFPEVFGGRFDEVDRIDMRYPNGFAVRWKRDAGNGTGEG